MLSLSHPQVVERSARCSQVLRYKCSMPPPPHPQWRGQEWAYVSWGKCPGPFIWLALLSTAAPQRKQLVFIKMAADARYFFLVFFPKAISPPLARGSNLTRINTVWNSHLMQSVFVCPPPSPDTHTHTHTHAHTHTYKQWEHKLLLWILIS